MDFEIISEISDIETFAVGLGVLDRKRLWKFYGKGRWRKRKGVAQVRLSSGRIRLAELHWYEAHGIGKREFKLKLPFLD
jgi:nucleotidyltransferase/DNA polymerase involved in DNA repair